MREPLRTDGHERGADRQLVGNSTYVCVGVGEREREIRALPILSPCHLHLAHCSGITTANVTVAALVVPAVETASLKSNLKPLVGPVLSGVEVGEAENFDSPETV